MRRAARKPVPPQAATAIRRLNECADCDAALSALAVLDAAELTLTYGPNAINVAMRRCASRLEVAETLFAILDQLADSASFEIIASARLQHGALEGAASAAAAGLACVERQPSVRCGVKLEHSQRALEAQVDHGTASHGAVAIDPSGRRAAGSRAAAPVEARR